MATERQNFLAQMAGKTIDPSSETFMGEVHSLMNTLRMYESNSLRQLKEKADGRARLRKKLEERRKQQQITPPKEEPITEKKPINKKKKKKNKKKNKKKK
jgi:hypothetical protein